MDVGTRLFTWLHGREVGRDGAGNRYFEDKRPPRAGDPNALTRRWIAYAGVVDASAVPPEWHAWLHHTSDAPLPELGRRPWQKPHLPNLTGTALAYRPAGHDYSGGQRAAASGDYESWAPDS